MFASSLPPAWDITALLNAADPQLDAPARHLWLINALAWLRHVPAVPSAPAPGATPLPVLRMRQLLAVLDQHPEHRQRVQGLLAACWRNLDATTLLADFGFAPRVGLWSEAFERLGARLLPASPDTADLSELFGLMFRAEDIAWLGELDDAALASLGRLLADAHAQALVAQPAALQSPLAWRAEFHDAVMVLSSQVRAAGLAGLLRRRISPQALVNRPFAQLAQAAEQLREAAEKLAEQPTDLPGAQTEISDGARVVAQTQVGQQAHYLRGLLMECRNAALTVHDHLEEHGVSVDVVFQVDQLLARVHRIEALLNCALAPDPGRDMTVLLTDLITAAQERRSLRMLFVHHYSMLARKVAERSAETGEHYITRDRSEYLQMLRRALGGGAVLAGTTFAKFAVLALGLSPFWAGLGAGLNYALSFVAVQLLQWTVATKQPAMTAPAMVAKLAEAPPSANAENAERFVDEAAHLIRSQMAGIVGNLLAVAPLVALVQVAAQYALGRPLVGVHEAHHVLESLTLLGPTLGYAAFTGVLLFLSSQIAGWAENAFVLHRLDSAIRYNPAIVARLGAARAQRWARWWRGSISGLAANVSLGLMLGLVPVVAKFFALPLDVRHVTLSAGQLAAAVSALGMDVWHDPQLWHAAAWCAAAIPLTALLNVGVSFFLAFRLALRARNVQVAERRALVRAILRRVVTRPLSFVLPP